MNIKSKMHKNNASLVKLDVLHVQLQQQTVRHVPLVIIWINLHLLVLNVILHVPSAVLLVLKHVLLAQPLNF